MNVPALFLPFKRLRSLTPFLATVPLMLGSVYRGLMQPHREDYGREDY